VQQDWLEALRGLPRQNLIVSHNPPSPRYERAARQKDWILQQGKVIGIAHADDDPLVVEIVVWTEPMRNGSYGLYVVFRVFCQKNYLPYFAVLFCFYDGKDKGRGQSERKFKSEESARSFMRSFSKYEELL
jgi:hypothetical protein